MSNLEKSNAEKEVQKLEGQDTNEAKNQLFIAKAKIDALNSSYYEKI